MKAVINDLINTLQKETRKKKSEYISPEVMKEFITDNTIDAISSQQIAYKAVAKSQPTSENPIKTPKLSAVPPITADTAPFAELMPRIMNCAKCVLCRSRANTVFGEGSPKAELMIIGEGPGRDEDEQGRPFVGKSGQLLTQMLGAMGFKRDDVYIANIVKCRPPNNRVPTPEEAQTCLPFLLEQIDIIKPKVLLLLGATPLKYILDKVGITKLHGEWFEFHGIKTLPSFHPAYLLRDPNQKKHAWEDLQKIMQFLGKPLPAKSYSAGK